MGTGSGGAHRDHRPPDRDGLYGRARSQSFRTMRRVDLTLSAERTIVGPSGVPETVRLAARFEFSEGTPPTPGELESALGQLREELDHAVARIPSAGGTARGLEELVETYRPRQAELVRLLEADGEISGAEANQLLAYLAQGGSPAPARPSDLPTPTEQPIAAAPLSLDRTPSVPRPIADLLQLYHIESLKQAGAVRARRQISYEEYMSLKRHFSAAAPAAPERPAEAAAGGSEAHPSDGR